MISKDLLTSLGFTEADYERIKAEELEKLNNPVYDYDSMTLDEAKDVKVNKELDKACNRTITSGFDHDINGISYHFYLPLTAQANFQGAESRFKDGKITSVRWTVFNNTEGKFERIDLDWATFEPIADKVFNIVDSNVRKLRDDLEPQVESIVVSDTLTEEEAIQQVKAITWDMV